jgi:hypothetical protein
MADIKAVFLLPLVDNDGRDLAVEILEVQTQLWDRLTAYSIEGYVEGIFQMADGSRATDVNEKYSVILDESRLSELEQVLAGFKAKTLQEKIYLEIYRNVELRLI